MLFCEQAIVAKNKRQTNIKMVTAAFAKRSCLNFAKRRSGLDIFQIFTPFFSPSGAGSFLLQTKSDKMARHEQRGYFVAYLESVLLVGKSQIQ